MSNFEEHDYTSEKFSFGIWKKIMKLVFKRKKYLFIMLFFVVGLALLDIVYPLANSYAIKTFFSDSPDFSKPTSSFSVMWGFLSVISSRFTVSSALRGIWKSKWGMTCATRLSRNCSCFPSRIMTEHPRAG